MNLLISLFVKRPRLVKDAVRRATALTPPREGDYAEGAKFITPLRNRDIRDVLRLPSIGLQFKKFRLFTQTDVDDAIKSLLQLFNQTGQTWNGLCPDHHFYILAAFEQTIRLGLRYTSHDSENRRFAFAL